MNPTTTRSLIDGNEAAARVAYLCSEVAAIYPITPSSPMGELADAWAAAGRANIFGTVPSIIEMQSEGGAAGAVHGAIQAGALTTTFTASQGLLLMLPNMFKIAGELSPAVFHIAARTIATHALSIFGDHSDVMAARSTGWAMLCSNTPQEAQDLALVAHAATLRARLPFMHFFDGFRTSHELNGVELVTEDDVRAMLPLEDVHALRARALDPDKPVLRGSAQNPDVFFQAREACNLYYDRAPAIVREEMQRFERLVGRRYDLFEYTGPPDADRVLVLMGSGVGAAQEAARDLASRGEKAGVLAVRLYRPWDAEAFLAALPESARRIAVLDRTKEPGAPGEPLLQDVSLTLGEHAGRAGSAMPLVIGGRYGLSSKEFVPAHAAAAFAELARDDPRPRFTLGITDDVTRLSLDPVPGVGGEPESVRRLVFYGLGSDGTVGASKNTIKIISDETGSHAQGYFVYDSKKSGSITVSHLRFAPEPISSSYLIHDADFVSCSQFGFLRQFDVLGCAGEGATVLLDSPYEADRVWDLLPRAVQETVVAKRLDVRAIDAHAIARETGLGQRINTVMQAAAFALLRIMPPERALERIRESIRRTYGKRGESVVTRNTRAAELAFDRVERVPTPEEATSEIGVGRAVPADAPDFVRRVTDALMRGEGELLPVSAMPPDGTFPTATAKYEKRGIAQDIPIWEPDLCIQCGLCSLVCPHAAIRVKSFEEPRTAGAPAGFKHAPGRGADFKGKRVTVQVAPDDCTGCKACVSVCPARSKESVKTKAINMRPRLEHLEPERDAFGFFTDIPAADPRTVSLNTVRGSQALEPLFEFSGACAGCGETPYLKLITQLYGDRMIVANATGCSSIYGGNLPTTPWATDKCGRGPAWANSLFEDNAEFGLGMRIATTARSVHAQALLRRLRSQIGLELADDLLAPCPADPDGVAERREAVARLRERLGTVNGPDARTLVALADVLVPRSHWIIGGDGWAYDIGYGGLDHTIAAGLDVNVLVLDTELYSNTGGQASKSTFRSAVAKFAAAGKPARKKDLGLLAMAYGNVYVAQVALGANPAQCLRAFTEAESYHGPSLILAYSPCIAHGIDMADANEHQKHAVSSGYWPLYRYDPRLAQTGRQPLSLDSRKPKGAFRDFAATEGRFAMLRRIDPARAEQLTRQAQNDIDERRRVYEQIAGVERDLDHAPREPGPTNGDCDGAGADGSQA